MSAFAALTSWEPLSSYIFTFIVLPSERVELDGVRYIVAEEAALECDLIIKGVAAMDNTSRIRIMRFTITTMITYQSA
jgi:hypothetical protein